MINWNIATQSENALIQAIKNKSEFSNIGFSDNGKIIRFCKLTFKWLTY